MGDIVTIFVVLAGLSAFAMLSAWFVRTGYGQFGGFARGRDDATWWRSSMPWPRGVQEDDDIGWHVPRPPGAVEQSPRIGFGTGKAIPPTRPQRPIHR